MHLVLWPHGRCVPQVPESRTLANLHQEVLLHVVEDSTPLACLPPSLLLLLLLQDIDHYDIEQALMKMLRSDPQALALIDEVGRNTKCRTGGGCTRRRFSN